MNMYRLESLIREDNERRLEVYVDRQRDEVAFIQSLQMTPSEMDRYQRRMVGISERLANVVAARPKVRKHAERLFR